MQKELRYRWEEVVALVVGDRTPHILFHPRCPFPARGIDFTVGRVGFRRTVNVLGKDVQFFVALPGEQEQQVSSGVFLVVLAEAKRGVADTL